ncbi:hypothetical protein M3P05_00035 [Sansalvadorimonas sp. 2012CJ34-2]|uniref:Fido domain-containing protein n=1 Tax=Parendozoicomonas callyspongiae TaxID=2942213 RepID=A0ABT0PAC4_9GAMM|nr:hypothetical protein [Sansalvadorimonas sp. 2012CJ34-2]MCL6268338.1 hypothetical protein [Sansalvadorimonas sp. 2012CJ34-2]
MESPTTSRSPSPSSTLIAPRSADGSPGRKTSTSSGSTLVENIQKTGDSLIPQDRPVSPGSFVKSKPIQARKTDPATGRPELIQQTEDEKFQHIKKQAESLRLKGASLNPCKGRQALINLPPIAASMFLQFDSVGLSQIQEAEALEQYLIKTTGAPPAYRTDNDRRRVNLSYEQGSALIKKGKTAEPLIIPEFVARGRPFCLRMLETLERKCLEMETASQAAESFWGKTAKFFTNALTSTTPSSTSEHYNITLQNLQEMHSDLFCSEGHRTAFPYEDRKIKPGQILGEKRVPAPGFSSAAMDILEGDPSLPQYTEAGLKAAQEFREEQIRNLKLPKNYPAFVLHFPENLSGRFARLSIPLTLDQAIKLATVKYYEKSLHQIEQNAALFCGVLEEISEAIKRADFKHFPEQFAEENIYSAINYIFGNHGELSSLYCQHSHEIFRFKMLPAEHIKKELQREIGEFNGSLGRAKTVGELCNAIGRHIPRLIQIHPFPNGNRYIFAQLAREILLHYGYPTAPSHNLKLFGMIGAKELSNYLLMSIVYFQDFEKKCQTRYSEFDVRPGQRLPTSAGEDIEMVARQIESIRKKHNLNPEYILEEDSTSSISTPTQVPEPQEKTSWEDEID